MQISHDFIHKIKSSITLSEFLGKYISVIPAGQGKYKALCPFHSEKTPSFTINDQEGFYHCFGCSAHGDVISFLTEKEGYSFIDAVKYLADHVGIAIPKEFTDEKQRLKNKEDYEVLTEINNFFKQELTKNIDITKYLSARQITKELINEFQIGYAPSVQIMQKFIADNNYDIEKLIELGIYKKSENQKPYFLFHDRIIFPIHNHFGQIVAFGGRITGEGQPKYLNSPEHKFFKKKEILFNFYRAKSAIKSAKTAIICEGYMDVIALHNHGFTNSVAPLGTAFSENHLHNLWQVTDNPVICLDGDMAGRKAMMRTAHIAIKMLQPGKSLSFAILPEGKDPDDLLKDLDGKKKLKKLLNENAASLGEILINEIISQKPSKSPEARAKIMQELNHLADKISNKLVRKQYLQYFNQACFHLFRGRRYNFARTKNNITIQHSSISQKELDLILFICFNIAELQQENIEEEFSLIEFNHEELIKIQIYLLSIKEEFDIENFQIWIEENLTELKDEILKKIKDMQKLNIIGNWQIFYKSYYLEKLQNDFKHFSQSQNPDEYKKSLEIYNQIEALQQELQSLLLVL